MIEIIVYKHNTYHNVTLAPNVILPLIMLEIEF